jgi:hypothetical protein
MPETDEPPPEQTPKRLSFREANLARDPKPDPMLESFTKPHGFFTKRKRSVAVGLLAVGATGALVYGLTHRNPNCDQYPPDKAAACQQGSRSGGGGGGHYFGSSSGSSSSESSSTSRGGFGSTGSAHASGGGE